MKRECESDEVVVVSDSDDEAEIKNAGNGTKMANNRNIKTVS